ncbi:hypothetical protein JCM3775_006301 [Rhodotorula graminis]
MSAAQRMQAAHEAAQKAAQHEQQQPHEPLLEDPFPVAALAPPVAANGPPKQGANGTSSTATKRNVDVSDESAFPSLGAPLAGSAPKSLWGAGGGAALRAKQAPTTSAQSQSSRASTPAPGTTAAADAASTTLSLPVASIHISAPSDHRRGPRGFSNERREAPTTLGEVLKEVMRRHDGVTIDASSSKVTATFIIKARGARADERAERAKAELTAWLEKKVEDKVLVPKDLRAVIIGAKGRTLKSITDSTGCSIQIPRDDELDADSTPADDPDSGPQIPITLSGASTAVAAAKQQILAIVRERTSKASVRVPDVPAELWALLGARVAAILERAGVAEGAADDEVRIDVPRRSSGQRGVDVVKDGGDDALLSSSSNATAAQQQADKAVTVSGDKDAVKRVIELIEHEVADLRATARVVSFQLPKRQHRFLAAPSVADKIPDALAQMWLHYHQGILLYGPCAKR